MAALPRRPNVYEVALTGAAGAVAFEVPEGAISFGIRARGAAVRWATSGTEGDPLGEYDELADGEGWDPPSVVNFGVDLASEVYVEAPAGDATAVFVVT